MRSSSSAVFLAVCLVFVFACATVELPDAASDHATLEEALAGLPPLVLDRLELSFRDPATRSSYRIVGPYRFVGVTEDGVELLGTDPDFHREATLVLFESADMLWALARIDDQEFLAPMGSANDLSR